MEFWERPTLLVSHGPQWQPHEGDWLLSWGIHRAHAHLPPVLVAPTAEDWGTSLSSWWEVKGEDGWCKRYGSRPGSKPSLEEGTAPSPGICGQPGSLTQPGEQLFICPVLAQGLLSSMKTRNTFIDFLGFSFSHQGSGISLKPTHHARTLSFSFESPSPKGH